MHHNTWHNNYAIVLMCFLSFQLLHRTFPYRSHFFAIPAFLMLIMNCETFIIEINALIQSLTSYNLADEARFPPSRLWEHNCSLLCTNLHVLPQFEDVAQDFSTLFTILGFCGLSCLSFFLCVFAQPLVLNDAGYPVV